MHALPPRTCLVHTWALAKLYIYRTWSRPLFPLLWLGFPCTPLKTKKGTLFIPRLLLGLDMFGSRTLEGPIKQATPAAVWGLGFRT